MIERVRAVEKEHRCSKRVSEELRKSDYIVRSMPFFRNPNTDTSYAAYGLTSIYLISACRRLIICVATILTQFWTI